MSSSIATVSDAALSFRFPEPPADYDRECVAAWSTGGVTADVARSYLASGGEPARVVGLMLDTVSTAIEGDATGVHLLTCARAMAAGATFDDSMLDSLEELCELEMEYDAAHAIALGYMLDVARGRVTDESLPAFVRQIAMLAPLVEATGAVTNRGKILLNALRTP